MLQLNGEGQQNGHSGQSESSTDMNAKKSPENGESVNGTTGSSATVQIKTEAEADDTSEKSSTDVKTSAPAKAKRGPRKTVAGAGDAAQTPATGTNGDVTAAVPEKKPRGRPKKKPDGTNSEQTDGKTPVKRPRKAIKKENDDGAQDGVGNGQNGETSSAAKKRTTSGTPRGRKPKVAKKDEEEEEFKPYFTDSDDETQKQAKQEETKQTTSSDQIVQEALRKLKSENTNDNNNGDACVDYFSWLESDDDFDFLTKVLIVIVP